MKALVIFSILIYFVNSYESFYAWKKKFKIQYSDLNTEQQHQKTYDMNCEFIELCYEKYKIQYKMEMNRFGDMSFNEFKIKHLGTSLPSVKNRGNKISWLDFDTKHEITNGHFGNYSPVVTPAFVDYRNFSFPVQSQFSCGSCYSFATVGILESRMIAKNSSFDTLLSPQYFIDCDLLDYGCVGGWPYTALNWLVYFGDNAVPSLDEYPYRAELGMCQHTTTIPMNIIATVQNFTAGNETQMQEIVANVGPVASVVDATLYLQLYSSGIFYDPTCNNNCSSVNHAVIIVGYGTNSVTRNDYWIVKNSWGKDWGQQGYLYIARNKGNQCNIACYAMYAI